MWSGRHAGVEPLVEQRIAPVRVLAVARVVDDVQVQRRRVVGQLDEIGATRMRRRRVEEVDERHAREHPAAAVGARGDGRRFEPLGEHEEAFALARVEHDLFPVLIHDHEPGGHASTVAPAPDLPRSPLGSWLVRAITIVEGRLEVAERPVPEPAPEGVVVRVHGAGLNRADLLQRAGVYPAPPGVPADIPGMEFAGVVERGRQRRHRTRASATACSASRAAAPRPSTSRCPPCTARSSPTHLDLVAMGGVPEVFVTAHDAMVTQAHVAAGEWVLVHAIGSGVGTAALQLAHEFGARVVGTARTAEKLERCRALGLDAGIEPARTADGALDVDALAWAIVEATGGGAQVTLDLVGGDYIVADVNAAAPKGRIVLIGTIAGGRATVPIMGILGKRLTVMGTVLRGRDVAEKKAAMDAFVRDVVPMLADGRIAPIVEADAPPRPRRRRVRAARIGHDLRQGHPRLSLKVS